MPDEDGNWVLSHTLFSDVTYRDYFADPVAWVNHKRFMTGYGKTRVFGAYDSLSRGQVACVLYNMAVAHNKVDDSSLAYNELFGYDTASPTSTARPTTPRRSPGPRRPAS